MVYSNRSCIKINSYYSNIIRYCESLRTTQTTTIIFFTFNYINTFSWYTYGSRSSTNRYPPPI
nr:MAG TPA: hypothetical protein [Caudoviricetes sp.]